MKLSVFACTHRKSENSLSFPNVKYIALEKATRVRAKIKAKFVVTGEKCFPWQTGALCIGPLPLSLQAQGFDFFLQRNSYIRLEF